MEQITDTDVQTMISNKLADLDHTPIEFTRIVDCNGKPFGYVFARASDYQAHEYASWQWFVNSWNEMVFVHGHYMDGRDEAHDDYLRRGR